MKMVMENYKIKKLKDLSLAALLMAGAAFSACSSSEDDVKDILQSPRTATRKMTFTSTVAPKEDVANTRSVDGNGMTTWVKDEEIALYYQTTNGYGKTTASVTAVNNGVATISATLEDAKDGGTIKLIYPASLVNDTGDDFDTSKLLSDQHGTIADISKNFDACKGEGWLVTNGETCSTTDVVDMKNQLLIAKFTPKFNNSAIDGITTLTLNITSYTYNVTPVSGTFDTNGIYVAMLPVDDKEIVITAQTASQKYGYAGKKVTLEKSKVYTNISVMMGKYVDLTGRENDYTAEDGDFLTGSLTGRSVLIPENKKVTLRNLTISESESYLSLIHCAGNNTITLSGSNSLSYTKGTFSAIYPGDTGKTLTIKGCGQLKASATGSYSAAIGASKNTGNCGNIRIEDGEITVNSGNYGVGIGVSAHSVERTCGSITIAGGHVVASISENNYGTAIGCYGDDSKTATCSEINITGGIVEATGGHDGAGIGSGRNSTCEAISISGGTVTASGGRYAAGIGAGYKTTCNFISISGGTVTASGGLDAAGIGIGYRGSCGIIIINGSLNKLDVTSGGRNIQPIDKGNSGSINDENIILDDQNLSSWTPGEPTTNYNWAVSTFYNNEWNANATRWELTKK